MVYTFFDKKASAARANKFAGSGIKNENMSNKELGHDLHQPNIKKFEKREYTQFYRQYIWGADLEE